MNLITEYMGKKALVLRAFDKDNLYWEVIKKQNEYGQDEFIITGDVIDKIEQALKIGYEAQGDVAIWKYRFEQADLCYRYAIQDQMNEETEKPTTNFEKITSSVESLADIMDNYRWCPYFSNSTCDSKIECKECIIEWSQKECERWTGGKY
jgi:hypothetical protein